MIMIYFLQNPRLPLVLAVGTSHRIAEIRRLTAEQSRDATGRLKLTCMLKSLVGRWQIEGTQYGADYLVERLGPVSEFWLDLPSPFVLAGKSVRAWLDANASPFAATPEECRQLGIKSS